MGTTGTLDYDPTWLKLVHSGSASVITFWATSGRPAARLVGETHGLGKDSTVAVRAGLGPEVGIECGSQAPSTAAGRRDVSWMSPASYGRIQRCSMANSWRPASSDPASDST